MPRFLGPHDTLNKQVDRDDQASKRGTYGRYSDEGRAQVGCYAAIHGVTSAMKHFEGTVY